MKLVPQVTQYPTSSTVAMVLTSIPTTYLGVVQWSRNDYHRNGVCAVGGVGCWQTKAHMEKDPQVPSVLHLAVTESENTGPDRRNAARLDKESILVNPFPRACITLKRNRQLHMATTK